ncbi:response regulator transcription factor [Sinosporangium album]|nr:LuxR C-terminal-related transcriptional regulator [Sinosporangium album]
MKEYRVVVLGHWRAMQTDQVVDDADVMIHRCRGLGDLAAAVHCSRANWIMVGYDYDDSDIQRVVMAAKAMREDVGLVLLGPRHDWRRCERWLKRGCRVYLEHTIDVPRAIAAIKAAQTLDINVMDHVFSRMLCDRVAGPAPHLTRREREVLELLRKGLRNKEIADVMHVTVNTVEYHMRHLLSKFSARSRLEVVERATALGLA